MVVHISGSPSVLCATLHHWSLLPPCPYRAAEAVDADLREDLCCALYNSVFNQVVLVQSLGTVRIYQAEVPSCVHALVLCVCYLSVPYCTAAFSALPAGFHGRCGTTDNTPVLVGMWL